MISPLEHLSRSKTIEKNVDMAMALSDGNLKSIGIFLDVLDELISDFNTIPERHKLLRIQNYLRYKGEIHDPRRAENIVGKAAHEYLVTFWTYLQDLKENVHMSRGSPLDIIRNTNLYIQRQISSKNSTNDQITNLIKSLLDLNSTLHYSIASQGENLAIIFHNPRITLYIVRRWTDYKIKPDKSYMHLIVIPDDDLSISYKIMNQGNIISLAVKNERGYFDEIFLSNPIHDCINKIQTASTRLNADHSTDAKAINEYTSCFENLCKLRGKFQNFSRTQGHLFLEDLKLTRKLIEISHERVLNIYFDPANKYVRTLKEVHSLLSGMWQSYINELDLSANIQDSLLEIKRNDGLYRLKNTDTSSQNTFKEENLSAILASLLRAAYYKHSKVSVQREAYIGSGRADIKIFNNGKTIGIIEAKLVTDNFLKKAYEGLHQLFKRYSENDIIHEGSTTDLYLVIFSFDREFSVIAQHIENAVNKYATEKNLTCEKHESSENHLKFTYIEPRKAYGFLDKTRHITIYLCNMEVDYKSKLLASVKRKK